MIKISIKLSVQNNVQKIFEFYGVPIESAI